jgi:hypothetical protein
MKMTETFHGFANESISIGVAGSRHGLGSAARSGGRVMNLRTGAGAGTALRGPPRQLQRK